MDGQCAKFVASSDLQCHITVVAVVSASDAWIIIALGMLTPSSCRSVMTLSVSSVAENCRMLHIFVSVTSNVESCLIQLHL